VQYTAPIPAADATARASKEGDMSRQNTTLSSTSFSQIDDLTREIAELAPLVNARFVVNEDKVQGIKSLNEPASDPAIRRKVG
jgi:hypothetical protein